MGTITLLRKKGVVFIFSNMSIKKKNNSPKQKKKMLYCVRKFKFLKWIRVKILVLNQ